jgi:hypothetical protein
VRDERNQTGNGLAGFGDYDLFAKLGALEELGELGLRLVNVHCLG